MDLILESREITQSVQDLLQLNPSQAGRPQRTVPGNLGRNKHTEKTQHYS